MYFSQVLGASLCFAGHVELLYNHAHGGNLKGTYSLTLVPDITPRVGERLHLFDAKFRVAWVDGKPGTEVEEIDPAAEGLPVGWFKQSDIHKMHAYRDAIGFCASPGSCRVGTVWVLYPGSEFCFCDEQAGRVSTTTGLSVGPSGVEAIPLAPGGSTDALAKVITSLHLEYGF